jgi:hypothetical protein
MYECDYSQSAPSPKQGPCSPAVGPPSHEGRGEAAEPSSPRFHRRQVRSGTFRTSVCGREGQLRQRQVAQYLYPLP